MADSLMMSPLLFDDVIKIENQHKFLLGNDIAT